MEYSETFQDAFNEYHDIRKMSAFATCVWVCVCACVCADTPVCVYEKCQYIFCVFE